MWDSLGWPCLTLVCLQAVWVHLGDSVDLGWAFSRSSGGELTVTDLRWP